MENVVSRGRYIYYLCIDFWTHLYFQSVVSKYEAKKYHSRHRDQGFQSSRVERGLKEKTILFLKFCKYSLVISL